MNRSLLTASGLCAALLFQGAQAQTAPSIDLEVIGDGITVDIEVGQDRAPLPVWPENPSLPSFGVPPACWATCATEPSIKW